MIIWIFVVSVFYWLNYPNILILIIFNNLPTSANLIFELHNVQFVTHVSLLFPFDISLFDIVLNVRCWKYFKKCIDYLKFFYVGDKKWRSFFQIQSVLFCLKFTFFIRRFASMCVVGAWGIITYIKYGIWYAIQDKWNRHANNQYCNSSMFFWHFCRMWGRNNTLWWFHILIFSDCCFDMFERLHLT